MNDFATGILWFMAGGGIGIIVMCLAIMAPDDDKED